MRGTHRAATELVIDTVVAFSGKQGDVGSEGGGGER